MKVIVRIIASPFVFAIQFIWMLFICFRVSYLFIRYGGEWITYDTERTKPTINRIYEELKSQSENKHSN